MNSTLPPLPALRSFEAAARLMSFKQASDELHVTPSAISHQIEKLERTLGVRLFHRLNRRLMLTDAGSAYIAKIGPAFDTIRSATDDISTRGATDTVTLTAPPSFAELWLLPRIGNFLASFPDIDLRVEATLRLVDFAKEPIDASIRYGTGHWPGVRSNRLVVEKLVPLCSPGLAAGDSPLRSPDDLSNHILIHSEQRLTSWSTWLRAAGFESVRPRRNIRFSQSGHSLKAAANGLGVILESEAMAREHLEAGELIVPFDPPSVDTAEAAYYVVTAPGETLPPKLQALESWLFQELNADGPAQSAGELASELG
jgi:LysR family glycine cleavage system transcriptional activator